MKTKNNRSVITSRYQPVARLDLLYVSENRGFGNSPNTYFGRGGTVAATEEFSETSTPLHIPSHPGMKYPVRHPPHFDIQVMTRHRRDERT